MSSLQTTTNPHSPQMFNLFKIFCLVIDHEKTPQGQPFSISCSTGDTVEDLKEKVKEKKPNDLDGVDASDLMLWRLKQPQRLKALRTMLKEGGISFSDDDPSSVVEELDPTGDLSSYFTSNDENPNPLPKECVHVLVEVPTFESQLARPNKRPKYEGVESKIPSSDDSTIMKLVVSAWDMKFQGDHHHLWLKAIRKMKEATDTQQNRRYTNQVAVCQSSGYGKSRTIREMSGLVFTIPINLRSLIETKEGNAYPPPDGDLTKRFMADDIPENKLQIYYTSLFEHIFTCVGSKLTKSFTKLDSGGIAVRWKEFLETRVENGRFEREIFFEEIAASFPSFWQGKRQNKGADDAEEANRALTKLLKIMDPNVEPSAREVRIVLALDEVHTLAEKRVSSPGSNAENDPNTKYKIDYVYNAMNAFLIQPIFFVVMSTQSDLRFLAPPARMHRSARMTRDMGYLHAPITETPSNCFNKLNVNRLKPYMLHDPIYLSLYGRPLWMALSNGYSKRLSAYLKGGSENETDVFTNDDNRRFCGQDIITTAQKKLIREGNPGKRYQSVSEEARIATVSCRLQPALDLSRQSAFDFAREAVRSHMATLFSVPQDREYMFVGWPSEPILAEAAAGLLHQWKLESTYGTPMISIMNEALNSSLLNLGEVGELVARILLLQAHDEAISQSLLGEDPVFSKPVFSKPVSVESFVSNLFYQEAADAFLDGVDNAKQPEIKRTPAREAFKKAFINCTHCLRYKGIININVLKDSLMRHVLIIPQMGAPGFDLIIPMLLDKDREDAFADDNISAIILQIKRCLNPSPGAMDKIDPRDMNGTSTDPEVNIWGDKQSKGRPYIAIVMELACDGPRKIKYKVLAAPERQSSRTADSSPRDTKYGITVYGLHETVYKVIANSSERRALERMLAIEPLLSSHARQDKEFLDAVKNLGPYGSAERVVFETSSGNY